ncbi:MAG: hypothetical protein EBU97_01295 [Rhodobacteraceae bacterium]|nr:hypothetical protein [Paracoccaceae bacterium]
MAVPQNVIVVLFDSLNRHLISPYGATEFDTPNLTRFAARATRFTNHQTVNAPSAPCSKTTVSKDKAKGRLTGRSRRWAMAMAAINTITKPSVVAA